MAQEEGAVLQFGDPTEFNAAMVRQRARALAAEAYEPAEGDLPDAVSDLTYDQLRDIRFRSASALWANEEPEYEVQFFHPGNVFTDLVRINVVASGEARQVLFSPQLFDYGPLVPEDLPKEGLGFSGFRVHGPVNRDDYLDEILVFQGASYFRAVGRSQTYGLSARGLAIGTAEPQGEEFPTFREFWIERPRPQSNSVVIHALLDSPSTTGAFRFTVRHGDFTVMDVESVFYPRAEIDRVGIAPMTSMFFFSPHDRQDVDDYREAVHDSDGLLIWNGRGEWLWRPLINPMILQVSSFVDQQPQGFGLMQRSRGFADFRDLEASYERRPSLWIEPVGDWGEGAVMLVEIPTAREVHDNIVAFWRPAERLLPGESYQYTYKLHWGPSVPLDRNLAYVAGTFGGAGGNPALHENTSRRLLVAEFVGGLLAEMTDLSEIEPVVTTTGGEMARPVISRNPHTSGIRVSMDFDPQGAQMIDLRCSLARGGKTISEVWIYRWAA
ncbi:glucan biosynthesis protein [Lutibaculum baratangense]|nr:glucan biosynthesis protein [Lutibaculum baratangense]